MPTDDYLLRIAVQVQNDKALAALTTNLEKAARAAPKVDKPIRRATTTTRNFGNVAQNVGYQVQDMAVQIQGGVDPIRALSQQLPQMAVGFGAVGAAVGVAVALLPAIFSMFSDGAEDAADLNEALDGLDGAMSRLGRTMSTTSLDGWIQEFNDASEAQRQFMRQTLELDLLMAERARRQVIDQAAQTISPLTEPPRPDNPARGSNLGIDFGAISRISAAGNIAEDLGVAREEVQRFLPLYEQLVATQGRDQQVVNQLRSALIEYNSTLGGSNDKLNEQIDFTWQLTQANQAAAEAQEALAQATGTGPGELIGTGETTRAPSTLQEETRRTLELFERYNPAIAELQNELGNLNDAYSLGAIGLEEYNKRVAQAQAQYDQSQIRDETERTMELFARYNPQLVALQDELGNLNEAYSLGVIGQEEFNKRVSDAQEAFDKSQETWSLGTEAVELFGQSFDTMLDGVLRGTTDLEDGVTSMVKVLLVQLGKLAAYQFIANTFAGTALGDAAGSLIPSAKGNVLDRGNVIPFARGGVVSSPTLFPMAQGAGLMGEAGPEAILPLTRTSNGDLGVRAEAQTFNVTVNNNAPGVDVSASQTGDGLNIDVVMRAVAGQIRRGGNEVAGAIEDTYSVGRGRATY